MMFETRLDRATWEAHCSERYEVPRLMLLDYLERRFDELRLKGKNVCLIDSRDERRISHSDLLAKSKSLAASFQRANLCPGDLVCLCSTNCVESVVAFLALLFMQCTVVIVKPIQDDPSVESLLKQLPIRAAIARGEYATRLRATVPNLDIVLDLNDADLWMLSADRFCRPVPTDPERTIAFMVETSGSTGEPKLVQHSHFSYIATCWSVREVHPAAQGVGLSLVPLSHISGTGMLIEHLSSGSTYVLVEENEIRNSDTKLFDLCEKFGVEQCMLLPAMLQTLAADRRVACRSHQLSHTAYINTGGAVLDDAIVRQLFAKLPKVRHVYNFYGMSECSVVGVADATRERPAEEVAWLEVGCNTAVKIEDLGGTRQAVPPGTVGELMVRSPAVAVGYHNNTAESASTFVRGPTTSVPSLAADRWLRTGDLAIMDEIGRFRIMDRIKSLIQCLGCPVLPSELERLLRQSFRVSHVSVVGIPHEKYTEAPTAFVVPSQVEEVESDTEQLRSLAYRMMANIDEHCAYPKRLFGGVIFLSNSLPEGQSQKVAKLELRSRHLARALDYIATVEYVPK